jgi:hypothetical protein
VKFISDPPSPPQLEDVPVEGKGKEEERRKVGEGDDTITIEDTDDDDKKTLQDRIQLRSRFSRPGLPHIPIIVEKPASLEASIPAPPRRPRNVVRKRATKKLKITETTSQEVGTANGIVEYLLMSTMF